MGFLGKSSSSILLNRRMWTIPESSTSTRGDRNILGTNPLNHLLRFFARGQDMTDEEVRDLLQEFAAPLSPYVTSPDRKTSAEALVKSLWLAMITGPEMEEETWKILRTRGNLDDDRKRPVKCIFKISRGVRMMGPVTDLSPETAPCPSRPAKSIGPPSWPISATPG